MIKLLHVLKNSGFVFLLTVLVGACAFTDSFKGSEASYDSLIYKQLQERRLFVRGEQRLALKILVATKELHDLQRGVAPGFEFPLNKDKNQVIVAISSQNRIPFLSDELKFILDGTKAESVVELTSNFQIQTLYPYAYPYYRVFVIDFIKKSSTKGDFQVQSSRGALGVKLQLRPPSQNLVN